MRRAAVLFNGGQGGSPEQPVVQQRLTTQLGALLRQDILPADADPFLADLVWWKVGAELSEGFLACRRLPSRWGRLAGSSKLEVV